MDLKDLNLGINKYEMNKYDEKIEETSSKDIAIIGVSADLPRAPNIDDFWQNLISGVECIGNFPSSRSDDINNYLCYIGKDYDNIKYFNGAYLEDIDKFDYNFFKMTPNQARYTNPLQRLFLQTAWNAIEDSGYAGNSIFSSSTGVFFGLVSDAEGYKYKQMIYDFEPEAAYQMTLTGNLSSIIPSRISYFLDLRGPSMIVDTACSSSLVAVHLACLAIRNGDCDQAIVGSVRLNLIPVDEGFRVGMESSDGFTRTFDDNSDGTGIGEGSMAVVLKPLNKAQRDGDNIYAVIKGSAVNQDGQSLGITAPNSKAQANVIVKAWKDANIDPLTIQYIESHGTGTKLGDPLEIDGIQMAFSRYTNEKQFCPIGSVKTNIGHLYEAAGLAGLIKMALSLKNKKIPPSLNFEIPNQKINFDETAVYVNNKLTDWDKTDQPRRGGISAFGFSGTNCHVILEESPIEECIKNKEVNKLNILAISAMSEASLKKIIIKYKNYLITHPETNIDDLCFTANTGRGHFIYRIIFIIENIKDLKDKITGICDKNLYDIDEQGIFFNKHNIIADDKKVRNNFDITESEKMEMSRKAKIKTDEFIRDMSIIKAASICNLYINGADIRWDSLYLNSNRKRISLPVYQFEKNRCWIEVGKQKKKEINLVKEKKEFPNQITKKYESNVILLGRDDKKYTKIQKKLAQIWANVLGYKEIDIYTGFFELGGDSLNASVIKSIIAKEFEVQMSIKDLFENDTIESLAKFISKSKKVEYIQIKVIEKKEFYQVSSAQKRIYILNMLNENQITYNIPGVFEIEGLDRGKFEEVIKKLINRHESLRTSFCIKDGEPMQVIHDKVGFNVEYMIAEDDELHDRIKSFVRPFMLDKVPLMRVGVIEVKNGKTILIFDMHHIITDGSSMGIMIKEFTSLYSGNELPEIRVQYKDFSFWHNKIMNTDYIEKQKKYWLDLFKGEIPILKMPTDYPRPQVQTSKGYKVTCELDIKLVELIDKFAKETGKTYYMIFLAVYTILFSKYTNQRDIIIGSPANGRIHGELENVIGMFVNMISMRNMPDGEKTFDEFLSEVKQNVVSAYENQSYQFDDLVKNLKIKRDLSRNPIFSVVFALADEDWTRFDVDGLKISPFCMESEPTRFDLTFFAIKGKHRINFEMRYLASLFKESTIKEFLNNYIKILRQVIENKNIRIEDIKVFEDLLQIESMKNDQDIEFDF